MKKRVCFLVYCLEDDGDSVSAFFHDIAALRMSRNSSVTLSVFARYRSYHNFGQEDRLMCTEDSQEVVKPLAPIQLRSASQIQSDFFDFLSAGKRDVPFADLYVLFIESHCSYWYVKSGSGSGQAVMSVGFLRQALEAVPFPIDVIAFDGCMMASLETAFELSSVTKYVIASQLAMGWLSILGATSKLPFNRLGTDGRAWAIGLAQCFIKRYQSSFDPKLVMPTDIAVFDVKHTRSLVHVLDQINTVYPLCNKRCNAPFRIYSSRGFISYDLWSCVHRAIPSEEDPLWKSFEEAFKRIVLFYQQNKVQKETVKDARLRSQLHGIAVCFYPTMDISKGSQCEKLLLWRHSKFIP